MPEKHKKPAIRFAGFTDAWEQRKLEELSVLITKGTTPLDKSGVGNINFIKIENIDPISGEIIPISKITIEEHEGYLKRSQLQENDILFSIAGTLGRVTAVNKWILPANTNQALAIIRLNTGYLDYIMTYLKGKAVSEYIKKNPTVGAQPNLSLEQVSNLIVSLPKIEEQKAIGSFFSNLDNLITLHQRKYDKLINVKKSMLEKMFPKNGIYVPEIRFKGFTDSWELHMLGEVLTERKILQKISNDAPLLAFAAGQGVIDRSERRSNNRDHLTLDPTNKFYLLTEYNDIVYNPSNLKYGAIDRNKYGKGLISPIYVTFITEEEPSFIELIVKSEKFKLRALQFEEGTVVKRQSVKPENLLTLDVKISPSRNEQKKIGEFFEHLNKLITLHQRELEKLKNIKKSCLEKMFV